jgi:hypothetical protein
MPDSNGLPKTYLPADSTNSCGRNFWTSLADTIVKHGTWSDSWCFLIIFHPELAQMCFIRVCTMTSLNTLYWSDYFQQTLSQMFLILPALHTDGSYTNIDSGALTGNSTVKATRILPNQTLGLSNGPFSVGTCITSHLRTGKFPH